MLSDAVQITKSSINVFCNGTVAFMGILQLINCKSPMKATVKACLVTFKIDRKS